MLPSPNAILLPGGVTPAGPAYGALLDALGGDAHAVAKELEVYTEPAPPPGYTLQSEIDGVLRTADDAGFDHFHLVGFSAGGAASLAFAAAHPERLHSLALIEPAWMGNVGLSPQEQAVRREFERIAQLPPDRSMEAFVAAQLAPGVTPPPALDPPPPWMRARPAGLRAITAAFGAGTLDVDALRGFERPVLFALGGLSNPDHYARMAERAAEIFSDLTLEVFAERHHFDPPHRAEPQRTAAVLLDHWISAERRELAG